jgi:hypothetical protein
MYIQKQQTNKYNTVPADHILLQGPAFGRVGNPNTVSCEKEIAASSVIPGVWQISFRLVVTNWLHSVSINHLRHTCSQV